MKVRNLLLASVAALLGCAEEIVGPPLTLDPTVAPATVCNAGDMENRELQTRVVIRPSSAGAFAPLPVGTLTPDASLSIPSVKLRAADGSTVAVRQVEFVTTREMALWVSRTTNAGSALSPGVYTVTVTNPDGQIGATMTGALRVVPPPTVTGVTRVDPVVPAMGVDMDEAQTVCNAFSTVISIAGTNFRPMDPSALVEVVNARGEVVRRVPEPDVRVMSATEIRVTLRAPMDPARRLAPGRYGLRVTNPDGASSTVLAQTDGGVVGDADGGVDPQSRAYPQGCRATNPSLFNVVPPPEVRAVEPVSACSTLERRFTVRGAHFRRGMVATIAAAMPYAVPSVGVTYVSTTGSINDFDTLTLTIPASAIAPGGGYALAVRNADGCDVTFAPQCPSGTMATGSPNECNGTVGMATGTGPRSITYYPDPVVTAINPTGLCTARLMPVTITGMNFHSTYGVQPVVRVNGTPLLNVMVTSTTTITADVPMSLMAATPLGTAYDVSVTVPEGCAGTRTRAFTLFPPPTVTAVRPASVCADRPTTALTVTGTNFHEFEGRRPTLTLGTTPATSLTNVRVMSETTILADLPEGTPPGGPYDLTVTSPVSCAAVLPRAFTFHAAPTITGLTAQASCTGGAPVLAVTGTNFHVTDGTLPTVTINSTPPVALRGVMVSSSSALLAEIPATVAAGTYTVTITMAEGCAVTSVPFMYSPTTLEPPSLAGIIPRRGWNGIDMPVTIVGTGLGPITALSLRGAGATGGDLALTDLSVVSSDLLSATIPAGGRAGGPYELFSAVSGCAIRLPAAYTIADAPAITITRVTPGFGWTGGATPIVVEGTGFVSTPRLFMFVPSLMPRMRPLARPVFINGTTVSAVVPAGIPPGSYAIAAINPDGGGGLSAPGIFRVTMNPPPTITTVSPGAGTTQIPTTVTIMGANFRSPRVTLMTAAGMSFAGSVTASSATSITVTFPTNTTPVGAYVVRVLNPDENTFADFGSFVVTNPAVKLGPFSMSSPLTVARRGAATFSSQLNVVTRFLYAAGGDSGAGGMTHTSVEFASVDLFGRLGTWRVQRYSLPAGVQNVHSAAVERGGFLYIVGGADGTNAPQPGVLRAKVLDVDSAPVISDPELVRLPMGTTGGLAVGAWIYRVSALMPMTDNANPGGESLPSDEVTAFFVFRSNVRLRWGAVPGATSYRVYRTPTVNGASGTETLLTTVTGTTYTDDGTATAATPATINNQPLAPGSTGVWASVGTLNVARRGASAAIAADPSGALFLYALAGGGASGSLSSYEVASLSADGSRLGPFMTGSSPLPSARESGAAAVADRLSAPSVGTASFVYITGGFSGSSALRTTEFGRVSSGGQLASIADTNSYSLRRGALNAMVVNGEFYAMGGTSMSPTDAALNSTNLSTVMASGVPGNFSNASVAMTTPRQRFGLTLASAYFFLIGGTSTGTNALASVEQTIY